MNPFNQFARILIAAGVAMLASNGMARQIIQRGPIFEEQSGKAHQ